MKLHTLFISDGNGVRSHAFIHAANAEKKAREWYEGFRRFGEPDTFPVLWQSLQKHEVVHLANGAAIEMQSTPLEDADGLLYTLEESHKALMRMADSNRLLAAHVEPGKVENSPGNPKYEDVLLPAEQLLYKSIKLMKGDAP